MPPGKQGGLVAFGLFLTAALIAAGTLIYFGGWDRPLAARGNPQTEDAYGDANTTPLSARVEGYVAAMLVRDNQDVRAGQVLMRVEDDNYLARVRQAEATLEAARAGVLALGEAQRALAAQAAQAGALAASTRARATYAAQEAVRQRAILPTDLGLLRDAQAAEADRRRLAAETARAGAFTANRDREAALLLAQQDEARARVAVLEAELRLARIQLDYTAIRAPFDGTLGPRLVRVGDLVRPGQEVIAITPLHDVWVTADFAETQLTDLRVGQPARVVFDAFPDHDLPAHVEGMEPLTGEQTTRSTPDNTTGNYTKVVQRVSVKVRLDLPAGDPLWGRLRPGLSALARVDTQGTPGLRVQPIRAGE